MSGSIFKNGAYSMGFDMNPNDALVWTQLLGSPSSVYIPSVALITAAVLMLSPFHIVLLFGCVANSFFILWTPPCVKIRIANQLCFVNNYFTFIL